MKLGNLLESVKLGKDVYDEQNTILEIEETFSEDDNNYKTYKVINNTLISLYENKDENNEKVLSKLMRINNKIKEVENKEDMSKSYARMKLDSIFEDYNYITEEIQSRKVLRSLDKDEFSKVLALINYNMIKLKEAAEVNVYKESVELPEVLKPHFNKQVNLVIETLM